MPKLNEQLPPADLLPDDLAKLVDEVDDLGDKHQDAHDLAFRLGHKEAIAAARRADDLAEGEAARNGEPSPGRPHEAERAAALVKAESDRDRYKAAKAQVLKEAHARLAEIAPDMLPQARDRFDASVDAYHEALAELRRTRLAMHDHGLEVGYWSSWLRGEKNVVFPAAGSERDHFGIDGYRAIGLNPWKALTQDLAGEPQKIVRLLDQAAPVPEPA